MRSTVLTALVLVFGLAALAEAASAAPYATKPVYRATPPPSGPCCVRKVWDARGHELGDLIDYDERFQSQQLSGYVAYRLASGDATPLLVYPEYIQGMQAVGGGTALFTTPDCSGNDMFGVIQSPPLAKRYAMVLQVGVYAYNATHAWLFVTDPLPTRAMPAPGTVFHSQWSETGACSPYPAPGYTMAGGFGGYRMHRVEDLYAKFTRPFYINY